MGTWRLTGWVTSCSVVEEHRSRHVGKDLLGDMLAVLVWTRWCRQRSANIPTWERKRRRRKGEREEKRERVWTSFTKSTLIADMSLNSQQICPPTYQDICIWMSPLVSPTISSTCLHATCHWCGTFIENYWIIFLSYLHIPCFILHQSNHKKNHRKKCLKPFDK